MGLVNDNYTGKDLITYQEFLQAVWDNDQKLLDEKKYTLEHLKNTDWKGYFDRTTILNFAIQKGKIDIAKRFINEGAPISPSDYLKDYDPHPIFKAIEGGYLEIVQLLCSKKHELINLTNFSGLKPLHVAAIYGKSTIVDYLLSEGANIHARTNANETALMFAILHNNSQVANKLLQTGSDLEASDDMGRTPLHIAVYSGCPDMVELIIKAGANVNTKDNDGETLFHTLISNSDNKEILQLLMNAGASVLEKNNDGFSPIQLAHRLGKLQTKKLLQEYLVKSTEENNLEKQANEIENRYFQEKEQQERIKQQEETQKEILKMQKQILAQLDSQRKDIEEIKKQGSKNEKDIDSITQKFKKLKRTTEESQQDKTEERSRKSFFSMFDV